MKNPLNKRLLRELTGEPGKYLVIFILLISCIGFVSGFLVADNSMLQAYNESFEKYNIEDGNFCSQTELNQETIAAIEAAGVTLYPNFYMDLEVSNDSTLRIFQNREAVNRVCVMDGVLPSSPDEIAIDRMYADNNRLSVGDSLSIEGHKLTICGLVALSDYSALFSDNNDTMFDAVKFGVSVMTPDGFDRFDTSHIRYSYSWIWNEAPQDTAGEKEKAEALLPTVVSNARLNTFVPRFLNQAICFTGEDMGKDKAMMTILLYIIIVILAFVFSVTISNTIAKEANVIGTLRASGYTRSELIRHYMTVPLFVTLLGAVIGNILGYTVFRTMCAGMYYGSYSLPSYVTVWNAEAFVMTTIIPLILMCVITFGILSHKLSLTPLQFIRRDLKKRKKRRALRLSRSIGFLSRFRIRIILQNISSYLTLFVGILFANLLLLFGLLFPPLLDHVQTDITGNMICSYQYLLQAPLEMADAGNPIAYLAAAAKLRAGTATSNEDAEKFSAYSLKTPDGRIPSEQIMVYGIAADSRYVPLDFEENSSLSDENLPAEESSARTDSAGSVFVSDGYAVKYGLQTGDTIELREPYEDRTYSFTVAGTYYYPAALAIFMEQQQFNQTFGYAQDYFSGYFSDTELTDIDDRYVSTVIDLESLTKITRQLHVSMGSMMYLVDAFAILIFLVVIYLLSKMIIEKNAPSISMVKILGYQNSEISRLYILSTTIVVLICLLVSLPITNTFMEWIFNTMLMSMMSGWFGYYVSPLVFVKMILLGAGTYAVVAALEYRRIRRIPMDEALKNVE